MATGETHSLREFVEVAFRWAGLDSKEHVVIDPNFYRPAEVNILLGNASKARERLNWQPKTLFEDLVNEMVVTDCRLLEVDHLLARRAPAPSLGAVSR